MKTLPTHFTKSGFSHTQLERSGNLAIFERRALKRGPNLPAHTHSHFELIFIRTAKAFQRAGVQFEAQEVYPSAFDWGQRGFTFTNLQEAQNRLRLYLSNGAA